MLCWIAVSSASTRPVLIKKIVMRFSCKRFLTPSETLAALQGALLPDRQETTL